METPDLTVPAKCRNADKPLRNAYEELIRAMEAAPPHMKKDIKKVADKVLDFRGQLLGIGTKSLFSIFKK